MIKELNMKSKNPLPVFKSILTFLISIPNVLGMS